MIQTKRIIEDYLPVESLSASASSEPRTKGHISTVHPWRARRPLVACRAAVYGALIEAGKSACDRQSQSEFLNRLCIWDVPQTTIEQARADILTAMEQRRPRVLDMFAGGGSIPLEALRLGCDTVALDLNPVAFCILKATVEYPQRFGISLAEDVRNWTERISREVQAQTRHLYPDIPLPKYILRQLESQQNLPVAVAVHRTLEPALFLWARTVQCPNPQCRATVPLYRQTWLRRKPSGYVALRPSPNPQKRRISFSVVTSAADDGFDFDPSEGLRGTSTTCLCCRSAVPAKYVRAYGDDPGYGQQLLCVVALNPVGPGKLYLVDESWVDGEDARQRQAEELATSLEAELGVSLEATIQPTGNAGLATGKSYLYGIKTFRDMYTPRQRAVLLTFIKAIRAVHSAMPRQGIPPDRAQAVTLYLGLWLSRLTDRFNALARWNSTTETVESFTSMKRFAMTWDFAEVNLFGGGSGDAQIAADYIAAYIEREARAGDPAIVLRGSATNLPTDRCESQSFDAVVTDPPYYDNESYSELADAFYIWLKPTVGHLFPEHFVGQLTPKKQECVAAAYRQGGTKESAHRFFEDCLRRALKEAHRVLKPSGILVMMYAHTSAAGWTSLINALRDSGFEVTEAWPIATETKSRAAHQDDASLKSSIFISARPRVLEGVGSFEENVQPDLLRLVRERVSTLLAGGKGLGGADLLMATVGAGLRPYTHFSDVKYANGESVDARSYLQEVERVVLETILEEVFKLPQDGVASVDPETRFYILWRFTYKEGFVDAGEGVEFEALVGAPPALVERRGKKFRVRSYIERGEDNRLGRPSGTTSAPVVDVLHRVLWLMENEPKALTEFLRVVRPNLEQLSLVAQVLSIPSLSRTGESPTREIKALRKLTANWATITESAVTGTDSKPGSRHLNLLEPR